MNKHPLRVFKETPGSTLQELKDLLAEDVVFSSPIFTREVKGKDLVAKVMFTSTTVREGHFTHEFKQDNDTVLIWEGKIDGHKLVSFELIVDDEQGKIKYRSVAFKPYPVVELFRDAMYEVLKDLIPEDMWHLQPQ
ncbi:hypothetical protein [Mucilaginibacter psychrotolerans]|uniref:Nuclear transport factor 2 family protein n=1 Tax=Mucilaginibacter psychrotolerans TaxID=1524096 RepID=A0A4Y8S8R6_9SPHI|nr:hypothetical protein [Mucilaginibacter psychrotolerans]TFF35493.1 hypothetical protein E2R66_18570 [Mucilaginibacter psychrotolerans]